MLYVVLALPLLAACICFLPCSLKLREYVYAVTVVLVAAAALLSVADYFIRGSWRMETVAGGLLVIDGFSCVLMLVIAVVGAACSLFAISYMKKEVADGHFALKRTGMFYALMQIFISTMYLSVLAGNIGLMWIAIEATTVVSALLVGFSSERQALEAAWKYIVICTVGIAFAMLGIILVWYATGADASAGQSALSWTYLMAHAKGFDTSLLKLAFIFLLIGFGTKAGIFPLHTWLPDAHSQAPAPVSAMLSGILLNCAVYAIIRCHMLMGAAGLGHYSGRLLIIFGLVSIVGAMPFTSVQKDIKRLLAYSSVDHMGIILLGFGLGGTAGYTAAILHIMNHALGKSVLFMSTGSVVQAYGTKMIYRIRGIGQMLPYTSVILFAAMLAIAGSPPFGIFISEFKVAVRLFAVVGPVAGIVFLLALAVVFSGFIYYCGKMFFSRLQHRYLLQDREKFSIVHCLLIFPLLLLIMQGTYIPAIFRSVISSIAGAMLGGGA